MSATTASRPPTACVSSSKCERNRAKSDRVRANFSDSWPILSIPRQWWSKLSEFGQMLSISGRSWSKPVSPGAVGPHLADSRGHIARSWPKLSQIWAQLGGKFEPMSFKRGRFQPKLAADSGERRPTIAALVPER